MLHSRQVMTDLLNRCSAPALTGGPPEAPVFDASGPALPDGSLDADALKAADEAATPDGVPLGGAPTPRTH
jgi:hypothetical protein